MGHAKMITGDALQRLLKKHERSNLDLFEYVLNGLQAYNAEQKKINPLRIRLNRPLSVRKFKILSALKDLDLAQMTDLDTRELFPDTKRLFPGVNIFSQPTHFDPAELERLKYLLNLIVDIQDKLKKGSIIEIEKLMEALSWQPIPHSFIEKLTGVYYCEDDVIKYIQGYRGETTGQEEPSYLNATHPYYSAELAIAVRTWIAMYDGSKSIDTYRPHKQQIEKYLYSLDVNLSDGAIGRIATVLNPESNRRKTKRVALHTSRQRIKT